MMPDDLKNLLQNADAVASMPVEDDRDLAQGARTILRRRRQAKRRLATTCCLIAGAAGLWWGRPFSAVEPQRGDQIVQQAPAEARLEAIHDRTLELEADAAMRLATRLMESQGRRTRLASYRQRAAAPDPIRRVRVEAETTARLMVHRADTLRGQSGGVDLAAKAYQRTVELFPSTHWADIARERLRETQEKNGQKPEANRENGHDAQNNDRNRRMAAADLDSGSRRA